MIRKKTFLINKTTLENRIIIYLGSDHAGFSLKEKIITWLADWGYVYEDMGAHELNEHDDYPDFIRPVAQAVSQDPEHRRGVIIGGSGQGEAMVANRVSGVRAAVCDSSVATHVGNGRRSATVRIVND